MATNLTGTQRGNEAYQNTASNAKGDSATSTMQIGGLYPGVVCETDLVTSMLTVRVGGLLLENCDFLAGIGAAFLGIETVNLPPVGSNVLVWYWPDHSYAIGTGLNIFDGGEEGSWTPPISGDSKFDVLKKAPVLQVKKSTSKRGFASGIQMPIDMLPGEWEMDSGIGPIIRVLYNFTQMAAGDLAKIETHLLNDMVRIVDNEFRHHHVGGDDLIWTEGTTTNREEHFTSYLHEAEGKDDPKGKLTGGSKGVFEGGEESGDANKYNATGRWRYSRYIGFLGDMVHTWVTKPTEVVSNTMKNALRTSHFREWIGADGTYFIQAASAVQIEVNPLQIVPIIEKSMKEPGFNPKEEQIKLDQKFLKLWGTGPKWDDLKLSCWQMRAYLRYIPLWHSLERFKQLEACGYCRIPTEEEMKDKAWDPTCGEGDKLAANPKATGEKFESGYTSLSMTNQGTFAMYSTSGSIIMANDNIQISAANNVDIKAGNGVYLQGKYIIGNAWREIHFWSMVGGVVLKARNMMKLLCERGRIWIKSDGALKQEAPDEVAPFKKKKKGPIDEKKLAPQKFEMRKAGIILDASRSCLELYGRAGVEVRADATKEDHESGTGTGYIVLNARSYIDKEKNITGGHIVMTSRTGQIIMKTFDSILLYTGWNFIVKVARRCLFDVAIMKIGRNLLFKGGSVISKGMFYAMQMIAKGGYIGPTNQVGKKEDIEDPPVEDHTKDEQGIDDWIGTVEDAIPWKPESNHLVDMDWDSTDKTSELDVNLFIGEFKAKKGLPEWMKTMYMGYKGDLFARTINNPAASGAFHLSHIEDWWNFEQPDSVQAVFVPSCYLLPGPRTQTGFTPYPGSGQQVWYYSGGEPPLGDAMPGHFTEKNIGGVAKAKQMPYRYWFLTDEAGT